jgi:pyridoxal phosphate enzyme (YggS family)
MVDLHRVQSNLDGVRARIAAACARAGRDPASVTLVVVTKSIPKELIPRLAGLGVTEIGENRPVEGLERVGALGGFRRHLIGHLQTNKAAKALQWADVIHSVDRTSLVRELAKHNKKPPVFVQVNVSRESSKGGFAPAEVEGAVADARRSLEVLGLMTMAPEGAEARPHFRRLRDLASRAGLEKLSMGMTQDFEIAVEEGATHVRVGTAIFAGVLL